MHSVTLPLPVACRHLTPSLSSHHSPSPPIPFTSLYFNLSCPPPSLPVPSSNSLPWTNPGGLSHRWVWVGAYLCMALPEVLSPIPSPPFIGLHTQCESRPLYVFMIYSFKFIQSLIKTVPHQRIKREEM